MYLVLGLHFFFILNSIVYSRKHFFVAVLGRLREGVYRGAEQAARDQARAGVSGVQRVHRSQDAHAHELYAVGDADLLRALPGKGERQNKTKQKGKKNQMVFSDGSILVRGYHEERFCAVDLVSFLFSRTRLVHRWFVSAARVRTSSFFAVLKQNRPPVCLLADY